MTKGNLLSFVAGVVFCIATGFFVKAKTTIQSDSLEKPIAKIIGMKVSAYCPCEKCCGKFADGMTSIGKNARTTLGVAADPKLLPYSTKLKIPGIGIREVDDTGGAMRQSAKQGIYHIDVRFHEHQKALNFGVKWLKVEILN